jgi:hypothetical protein
MINNDRKVGQGPAHKRPNRSHDPAAEARTNLLAKAPAYLGGGLALILLGWFAAGCGPPWLMVSMGVMSCLYWLVELVLWLRPRSEGSIEIRGSAAGTGSSTPIVTAGPKLELTDPILGSVVFEQEEGQWATRPLEEHGMGSICMIADERGPSREDLEAARFYWLRADTLSRSTRQLLEQSAASPEWNAFSDEIRHLQLAEMLVQGRTRAGFTGCIYLRPDCPATTLSTRLWRCSVRDDQAVDLGFDFGS